MKIISIAAIGKNRVIGKDNQLLWHLPNDFQFFKKETSHHFILMGRKTFESFPKPLPNRTHLVITKNKDYQSENPQVIIFHSIEAAIDFAKKEQQEKLFIIGGATIYKQTLPIVDEMLLTEVDYSGEGDAYFPAFDKENFEETTIKTQPVDEKHQYAFEIKKYKKK